MPTSITAFQGRVGDRNNLGIPGALALAASLAMDRGLPLFTVGQPASALNTDWKVELEAAVPDLRRLAAHLSDQFAKGHCPITVLNRCAASIATIPRVLAQRSNACIVWFDAHADLNTPTSSTSGYLGGLALSAPAGLWDSGFGGQLQLHDIVLVGARDLDPYEQQLVSSGQVRLVPADSTDLAGAILEAVAGRPVYVHLDCDVLEPGIVPTDFQVPGGLSLESLHQACSGLARLDLVGLEIAEFQYSWSENMEPVSPLALIEALRPLLIAIAQTGEVLSLQGVPAQS